MTLIYAVLLAFLQAPGVTNAAGGEEPIRMTAGGWLFMGAAWIFILALTYYTFSKVLGGGKK